MKPSVSVIVPIYQTENCLSRCLDSLQRQSLTNIEILLIDDGSTDKCGEICDEFAAKDGRFKVFHQIHAGTSVARNLGIRMATADYLMFTDSDDWVHEDFCKDAYECAMQHEADVVKFGFQDVIPHKLFGLQFKKIYSLPDGYITREKMIDHLVKIGSPSWDKLFRKSLFNTIKYPEGNTYEDLILYRVVYIAKRIYCHNKVLYYHCYRPGSTTTLRTTKICKDYFEMHLQQLKDFTSWNLYSPQEIDLQRQQIALTYCIRQKSDNSDPYYVLFSQTLLHTKTIPEIFTWKRKILFVLFKHCPKLFDFVCTVFGKKYK